MLKKLSIFIIVATTALGFIGCNKDNEDDVISSLKGKDLTLSIMMANDEIKSITKQFPSSTPSQSEDYYYLQISNDALLLLYAVVIALCCSSVNVLATKTS